MKIELDVTENFFKTMENYRKTYQEYMKISEEEIPEDETLIVVAMLSDIDEMNKLMCHRKAKGAV